MDMISKPDVQILRCEHVKVPRWTFSNFSDPYWRFYWNTAGKAVVKTADCRVTLTRDAFVIIPAGTVFSTEAPGAFEQFYMHFIVGAPFNKLKKAIARFPVDAAFAQKLEKVAILYRDTPNDARVELLLYALLYEAMSAFEEGEFTRKPLDARIERAIKMIEKRIDEPVSNIFLAEALKMSVNGFIRLFSVETGVSPQYYSRDFRISRAGLLLRFSGETIDRVASITGFSDRYHFSREFKKFMGISPAQYRKAENI